MQVKVKDSQFLREEVTGKVGTVLDQTEHAYKLRMVTGAVYWVPKMYCVKMNESS